MFELVSDYAPAGDQPQAIEKLTAGILSGAKQSVVMIAQTKHYLVERQ